MNKQKLKNWEKIIAIFGVVLIVVLSYFILFYVYKSGTLPPHPSPSVVDGKASITDDTIVITIIYVSREEPISHFDGFLENNTTASNVKEYFNVPKILNNDTSNVTFYDKDNDIAISVGDEFIVRGVWVSKMDAFYLISQGNVVLKLSQGEDW